MNTALLFDAIRPFAPSGAWREGARVVRALRSSVRRPGRAIVLMYHRVAPSPDYLGLSVSPAHFEQQLMQLKRGCRVVPLRELVTRLSSPEPLRDDWASVTFDDGYRDNLELAEPILARLGVPATVFVATDYIDAVRVPLGDRICRAFTRLWKRDGGRLEWNALGDVDLDHVARSILKHPGSFTPLRRLMEHLKELSPEMAECYTRAVERRAGSSAADASEMLDWDGVRTLARRGIEIGSHTVSHPILSRLTRARGDDEIVSSKQRIEAEIQADVSGFAFPNGQRDDFSADTLHSVRDAGYAYACTAIRGTNVPGSDPYTLLRLGAGDYGPAFFDLKLALGK